MLSLKAINTLAQDMKKLGVVGVQLIGGEPSLHPEIAQIIRTLSNNSLKIEVVSNGMPSLLKNCISSSRYIDALYISIDGTEKTHDYLRHKHGSFKSALNSIRQFSQKGVRVFVICTLNKLNQHQVIDLYKKVTNDHAEKLIVKCALPIGNGSNNNLIISQKEQREIRKKVLTITNREHLQIWDQMYAALDTTGKYSFFGCPAGRFSIRVSPIGNVHWCVYSQEVLGNILTSSLKDIWNSTIQSNNFYGPSSCRYSPRCGGPCKLSKEFRRTRNCPE